MGARGSWSDGVWRRVLLSGSGGVPRGVTSYSCVFLPTRFTRTQLALVRPSVSTSRFGGLSDADALKNDVSSQLEARNVLID